MRKKEQIMGMPITVDIPDCDIDEVFKEVFDRLKEIDNKYSLYNKDSELSRYQRKDLTYKDLSAEFREIIKACDEAELWTDGYFSAHFGDHFDPTGYIKGWAINEAGKLIEKNGFRTFCISAGGDILAKSNTDKTWNIGIQSPLNKTEILNKLSIKNGAVATSGNYERGAHIFNPKTHKLADEILSASVTGPEIIMADVYATAVFAEGLSGLIMIEESEGYEGFIVDKNGDWYMTSEGEDVFQII